MILLLGPAAQAAGVRDLDELYEKKPAQPWGTIFKRFFNHSEFGKSYALVVGIGDYGGEWPGLGDAPLDDAQTGARLPDQ